MVPIKGTQGRYSSYPIWVLVKSRINFRIYSTKFWPLVGMVCRFWVAKKARLNKIAITIQEVISTCAWTWKPPICQYKCWPTSTLDISYKSLRSLSMSIKICAICVLPPLKMNYKIRNEDSYKQKSSFLGIFSSSKYSLLRIYVIFTK
jgi:hypothetical protein